MCQGWRAARLPLDGTFTTTLPGNLPPTLHVMSQARTRNLYYYNLTSDAISQTRPNGSLSQSTIQDVADDQGHTMNGGKRWHVCPACGKLFGRFQEKKRHIRQDHTVHTPTQCPFCRFVWSRPDKFKAHLLSNHVENFIAGALEPLRGQRLLEFVDAYYPIKTMIISTG